MRGQMSALHTFLFEKVDLGKDTRMHSGLYYNFGPAANTPDAGK